MVKKAVKQIADAVSFKPNYEDGVIHYLKEIPRRMLKAILLFFSKKGAVMMTTPLTLFV